MRPAILATLLSLSASTLWAQRSVRVDWPLVNILLRGAPGRPVMFVMGANPQGKFAGFRMEWVLFEPTEVIQWTAAVRSGLDTLPPKGKSGTPQRLAPALRSVRADRFLTVSVSGKRRSDERLVLVSADSAGKGISASGSPAHFREFVDGLASMAAWTLQLDSGNPPPGSDGPLCPAEAEYLHQDRLDRPPERVSGPPLHYPDFERSAGQMGVVWLQMLIDSLGRPDNANTCVVLSDSDGFTRTALAMAKESRFKPALRAGQPVTALVLLPVSYSIRW